jgi:hypothetical protein
MGALLLVIASTRPSVDERNMWFTAIAAGLALLGLLAAGAAVYFALPSYRELVDRERARPLPELRFQVPYGASGEWRDVPHDTTVRVNHRDFSARVIVHNAGDAVLRWGILNIQVPVDCNIAPLESDAGRHRATTPFVSGELRPGETVSCSATVAERDFPPVHDFIYVVRVTPPKAGTWPLAAVLDGYPAVRGWTRIDVEVPDDP